MPKWIISVREMNISGWTPCRLEQVRADRRSPLMEMQFEATCTVRALPEVASRPRRHLAPKVIEERAREWSSHLVYVTPGAKEVHVSESSLG